VLIVGAPARRVRELTERHPAAFPQTRELGRK
jgi:hypothetical protein